MFDSIKLRKQHGYQAIRDIRTATVKAPFRGFPRLDGEKCDLSCLACTAVCPTGAIATEPLRIDLGRCTFCGECERGCGTGAIQFSSAHSLASTDRNDLIIQSGQTPESFRETAIQSRREIHRLFGRSLKLRQVSAAGCNGCEMELNAANNVNFDMGRFGIEFVASPRHADGIVITGPISRNMAPALKDAYLSISEPRIVVAVGTCAISGGIFADSAQLDRSFLDEVPVDLYIPGCPPHPLTIIGGLLDFRRHK
ncbi:4Fe-4S binding protein [bacterium]|nr:4Fe-4S binding protein [bacterium]MBU1064234.1 4Fe-4S binding protein [bacterium]MBU1633999.1 4Fe-4S binding protein [bacterium]MBU1874229.1 4Fe-4S binding protein [bacterium]